MIKQCLNCKSEFLTNGNLKKFCCVSCKGHYRWTHGLVKNKSRAKTRYCIICSNKLPIRKQKYCHSCIPNYNNSYPAKLSRQRYNNSERAKELKKRYLKEYRKKIHYIHQKKWIKKNMEGNPRFRMMFYLRKRLTDNFRMRHIKKLNGSINKYGIDFNKIVKYLEKTMPKDFNERKYHIDHIRPLCSFDLNDPNQVKEAFEVSNLRWLPAHDNISKGGRIQPLINF